MKTISIHTKGVCRNNQYRHNRGGYGAIILMDGSMIELAQGYADTSNIRMELRAVIAALKRISCPASILVLPCTKLIYEAFERDWLNDWESNAWKTTKNKPVKNSDLWKELLLLSQQHEIKCIWAAGQSKTSQQKRVRTLACRAADLGKLLPDDTPTTVTTVG